MKFLAAGLVFLVPLASAVWLPEHVWVLLLASALAGFFLNLSEFEWFKAPGFAGKLRRAVEDAYATVKQMRELAKPLIHYGLVVLVGANRPRIVEGRQKHDLRDEFEKVGKALGVWDDELQKTSEQFFHVHAWDHLVAIKRRLRNHPFMDEDRRERLRELVEAGRERLPSREEVERILGDLAQEVDVPELIDDYVHYAETRTFRRPDARRD